LSEMSLAAILKLVQVYLLATVKYFFTFPFALLIGIDFLPTVITVTIGGISGFYFFYYLSGYMIRTYDLHYPKVTNMMKQLLRIDLFHHVNRNKKAPKKIKRKTRLIAKLKQQYGFWGLIITTPVLLSIPFGAFLLKKYYAQKKNIVTYMTISIIGWAMLFSSIFMMLPKSI